MKFDFFQRCKQKSLTQIQIIWCENSMRLWLVWLDVAKHPFSPTVWVPWGTSFLPYVNSWQHTGVWLLSLMFSFTGTPKGCSQCFHHPICMHIRDCFNSSATPCTWPCWISLYSHEKTSQAYLHLQNELVSFRIPFRQVFFLFFAREFITFTK